VKQVDPATYRLSSECSFVQGISFLLPSRRGTDMFRTFRDRLELCTMFRCLEETPFDGQLSQIISFIKLIHNVLLATLFHVRIFSCVPPTNFSTVRTVKKIFRSTAHEHYLSSVMILNLPCEFAHLFALLIPADTATVV
jgi:hypothetical protein